MNQKVTPRKFTRRDFLKLGARGALLTALTGSTLSAMARFKPSQAAPAPPGAAPVAAVPPAHPNATSIFERLVATDGFISLPGRRTPDNGIYVFGFRKAPVSSGSQTGSIDDAINALKGQVQHPAPILYFNENDDVYLTVTNLGLLVRPDLDDAHTVHWHGFRNPNSIFDGVPEVSISVPVARDFSFFYLPRDAGTYMYHCHFEDTEHVQMGMDGIVFIRPTMGHNYAYNDPGTSFHREYTLLLNEIWTLAHDNLRDVQENTWSDYKANYWVINGRSYPDTIIPNGGDPGLEASQPVSSLIQALPGERILMRFANLGFEQQSMQLLGIRMEVKAHDAAFLGPLAYETDTLYIGPGEARDVFFTAPSYDPARPGGSDAAGAYNVYWLKNRNYQRLVNDGPDNPDFEPGLGGQITQVRVYDPGNHHADLDAGQDRPNQTVPKV